MKRKEQERQQKKDLRGDISINKSEEEKKEEVDDNRGKWGEGKESGRLNCVKASLTCNQSLCLYVRNNNPHLNQFSFILHSTVQ